MFRKKLRSRGAFRKWTATDPRRPSSRTLRLQKDSRYPEGRECPITTNTVLPSRELIQSGPSFLQLPLLATNSIEATSALLPILFSSPWIQCAIRVVKRVNEVSRARSSFRRHRHAHGSFFSLNVDCGGARSGRPPSASLISVVVMQARFHTKV